MDADQPFPLFRIPLDPGYTRWQTCVVCRRNGLPCIGLGDSDHLVIACRGCGELMGLRVGWQDTQCPRCGEFNLWPADFPMADAAVCFGCLNDGGAAISHSSELGYVEWPDASRGLVAEGDENVARREGLELWSDEWGPPTRYVRAPAASLLELLRTPRHDAWQSEYWPFHCGRFCAFLGHWKQADFERQADGQGQGWFEANLDPESGASWDWLQDDFAQSYVYQCLVCQSFRVFVDTT
jgi:uncharacterized protein CbrC (UPF0167 family)